jgi:hypothetical protein
MHARSSVAAFVLALALALYYLSFELQWRFDGSTDAGRLVPLAVERIVLIELTPQAGSAIRLERQPGSADWTMTSADRRYPVSTSAMHRVYRGLHDALLEGGWSATGAGDPFGVVTPSLIATFHEHHGASCRLVFGALAPDAEYRYVQRDRDPAIYLAPVFLYDALARADRLRDRRLLLLGNDAFNRLQRVSAHYPTEATPRWTVQQTAGDWCVEPGADWAGPELAGALAGLLNIEGDQLANPATAHIELELVLELADPPTRVRIGVGVRDNETRWLLLPTGDAARVDELPLLPFLAGTADALRARRLIAGGGGPGSIAQMIATGAGAHVELQAVSRGSATVLEVVAAQPDLLREHYDARQAAKFAREIDAVEFSVVLAAGCDAAALARYGLADPIARWKISRRTRDGNTQTLTTELLVGSLLAVDQVAVHVVGRPCIFSVAGALAQRLRAGPLTLRSHQLLPQLSSREQVEQISWILPGQPQRTVQRQQGTWLEGGRQLDSRSVLALIDAVASATVLAFEPELNQTPPAAALLRVGQHSLWLTADHIGILGGPGGLPDARTLHELDRAVTAVFPR